MAETSVVLRGFPSGLRAIARCWFTCVICMALAYAGTLAALQMRWVPVEAAQEAAMFLPGSEAFDSLAARSIPEEALFVLFNGSATVFLWCILVLPLGLYDPGRRDRFPRLLRRIALADHKTMEWFWPFRAKIREDIRDVYALTLLFPLVMPVVSGLHLGFVVASLADQGDYFVSTVIGVALLVPHGLFELSAMFLPGALHRVLFRELEQGMLQGETAAVWARVQQAISVRSLAPWVAVSLCLVVIAAFIEADATMPLARALADALGYTLE